jgi:cytochrome c oxidase subunit 3
LLNTIVLLSSGITVTWTHHSILSQNINEALLRLILTIILGFYFTLLQLIEYKETRFSISDRVYGTTFFVTTGFHGLHVIIGSTFLAVSFIRLLNNHFTSSHHVGFEAAAWYWHFVDVVWLGLFLSIYWWGNKFEKYKRFIKANNYTFCIMDYQSLHLNQLTRKQMS